jgi:predicted amidohydrolase YtcJ
LNECNLTGTNSWEAVLDTLEKFAKSHPSGWLIGRGWDQNDWSDKAYPTNEKLNELFPHRPVLLTRIDGHAVFANEALLTIAGIQKSRALTGGEIVFNGNKPTGLLIDNAIDLVEKIIPQPTITEMTQWLIDAQKNCFAAGLTSVQDCGLDAMEIELIQQLYKQNKLLMRMYVMLSDKKENYDWAFKNGKIKIDKLSVRGFKLYADGALGSRGACLLQPYNDRPKHYGFLLKSSAYYDSIYLVIAKHGWQACTHAIGDSANRIILKKYIATLEDHSGPQPKLMLKKYKATLKHQPDLRWRIEHAQVINKSDISLFGYCQIIPSVQPTHATSDMYWAKQRLGAAREEEAYAYLDLLKQNGWLPLGTDFPVETIYPINTFYAAVVRKDAQGFPASGYQANNALSREQALKGMTIWAAKAAFEEKEKGSLEKGKYADFVILDKIY